MNFLGLDPFQANPEYILTSQIAGILSQYNGKDNIEIEFKYGEIKGFYQSYWQNDFQKYKFDQVTTNNLGQLINYHVTEQNREHQLSLKTLSNSSLILLNNLGRKYEVKGDYYETQHKQFYKMRDFMSKLCIENARKSPNNGVNFFTNNIKNNEGSRQFKMINFSEMRLDVIVKGGVNDGRYSYSAGEGWIKTIKQNLLPRQFDLMMGGQVFRLAVKKENQQKVSSQQIIDVLESKNIHLRFKRSLKMKKSQKNIFTLSEVYQPCQQRRNELIQDLKDLCAMNEQEMKSFVVNIFQQFYMNDNDENSFDIDRNSKFEIESQFTQEAVKKMAGYNPFDEKQPRISINQEYIRRSIMCGLQDLYVLSFTDHRTKCLEGQVMTRMKIIENQQKMCYRLDNQNGSYMHDLIYQFMRD